MLGASVDCYGSRPSVSNVSKSPEKEDEAQSDEDDGTSSITQSVSDHSKRKTEVERQTILETDPRTEEVRPYEVLCKTCQKWIKLGTKQRYALGNWRGHQKRCSGSLSVPCFLPSPIIAHLVDSQAEQPHCDSGEEIEARE